MGPSICDTMLGLKTLGIWGILEFLIMDSILYVIKNIPNVNFRLIFHPFPLCLSNLL